MAAVLHGQQEDAGGGQEEGAAEDRDSRWPEHRLHISI
jgi:hypothetical protein